MARKKELPLEARQSVVVLRKGRLFEIARKLKISYHAVNYSLQRAAQTGSHNYSSVYTVIIVYIQIFKY